MRCNGFNLRDILQLASRFSFVGLLLGASCLKADSLPLTPGTILIGQSGYPSGSISEVSKTGSLVGTLNLAVLDDIPESLTVLNGQLFVGDGSGAVSHIDPSTGNVLGSFNTPSIALNSLGTLNGNLLAFPTLSVMGELETIYVYSSDGTQLKTITLQSAPANVQWNGITSNGTVLYLADYTSGDIFEYSTGGVFLGSFDAHTGSGLTGISYDSSNNSLWVSSGVTGMAYDVSTSGTVLSDFATGSNYGGIEVIPETATPEPMSFMLVGLGLGYAVVRARRLAR